MAVQHGDEASTPASAAVEHLSSYDFVAYIPPILESSDRTTIAAVARGAYSKMIEVLDASGFHYEDSLGLVVSDRGFELRFEEADSGFNFALFDNQIVARRSGSTLERFERWYRAFMPSLGSLVDEVVADLQSVSGWKSLRVLRAQSRFQVIAFDFREVHEDGSVSAPLKNSQVISKLISAIPDDDGALVGPTSVSALGRIDYKVSRWGRLENNLPVREIYDIEAPGNQNYRSLWLTLAVIGETFDDADEVREKFDFDLFIANNGMDIYEDIFRTKFLGRFFGDLFAGFRFETTPSQLP